MVKIFRTARAAAFAACLVLLSACSNDLLGLFSANDLDVRLEARDSFVFLSHEDRNPSFGDEFTFIALADTHILNGNAHGFERLAQAVSRHNADFVVLLGDITQNGARGDIQRFIDIANSVPVPVYPVIGNHDIYFNNWSAWRDMIGSTRYRVDSRRADGSIAATFFVLDSANAFFGRSQLDWLERELASAGGRVFVFSHINVFSDSGISHVQFIDARERARLVSILRGRSQMMMSGHAHRYFVTNAGGVSFVTLEDFRSNRTFAVVSVTNSGVTHSIDSL
ncbi:MAG: metallophosphoesterase [Spirochaetes bacterium]|nr:metallophosphoesterase [Spirochaetota bacterium]